MTTEAISFVSKPQCVDNKFSRGPGLVLRMYLTHRRRLAIGVELLRCNGIYLREDDARFLMREVGNSVLVNLAGNSFEMCSFISVFCMLLTLRALCAKRSFDT